MFLASCCAKRLRADWTGLDVGYSTNCHVDVVIEKNRRRAKGVNGKRDTTVRRPTEQATGTRFPLCKTRQDEKSKNTQNINRK